MDEVHHNMQLPDGALPVAVIEVVTYLVDDGDQQFVVRVGGNPQLSAALGLLRLAEDSLIRAYMGEDDSNVDFDRDAD